jgi:hypothetical protein
LGLLRGGLLLGELFPERLQRGMKRGGRLGGVGRRGEWSGAKRRILAEGSVEPDPDLTGDLQSKQGLSVPSLALVDRRVSNLPEGMEQVGHFLGNGAIKGQTTQNIIEVPGRIVIAGGSRRDRERQQFRELPELDQRRAGITDEVPFRQRSMADQLGIVNREEAEIGRYALHWCPMPHPGGWVHGRAMPPVSKFMEKARSERSICQSDGIPRIDRREIPARRS